MKENDPKRKYLDYWYSLSGNLGCTKSFGLKVWLEQQKKIDAYEKLVASMRNEFDLWDDDSELAGIIEAQIKNFEILRGDDQ